MARLFWDASALVKRYFAEDYSDVVDALFDAVGLANMITSPWGYVESYAILVRRLNEKALDVASFNAAIAALQAEVVDHPEFSILPAGDAVLFSCLSLIRKHSLNSTDASILRLLLDYIHATGARDCVLVACDKRFLRAAGNEGIKTVNPQDVAASDVLSLIASF